MDINDAFLARLASELARLRFEVAAILTGLERLGGDPQAIRQATEILVASPAFQEIAQEIFERLRGPL